MQQLVKFSCLHICSRTSNCLRLGSEYFLVECLLLRTCRALPFYRRAEAWADLIKQRTAALLERRRLRHPAAVQPFLQNQQNASDAVQEQKNRLQQEQKQAYLEALEELLAMPVTLLAQLLVQSPHLYVEPQNLKGREELQWHLKQISLLPPTTMLAAVCEGVAYHHAGETF